MKIVIKKSKRNTEIARLNALATKIGELKKLATKLHQYAAHDSCSSEHNSGEDDDEECDCGLAGVQAEFKRLVE